jgi:hypothetical protein
MIILFDKRDATSVFAPPTAHSLDSLSQNASIPLGIICIIAGFLLASFGKRLFRLSLFLVGFYMFAVLAYIILSQVEPKNSSGNPIMENRENIYMGVCVGVGILGGFLVTCLFKVGVLFIGATAGFFLAAYIKAAAGIKSDDVAISLTIGLVLVGAFISYFVIDHAIILGTAFVGGYLVGFGVDVYAKTGIVQSLNELVTKQNASSISSPSGPAIGILIGMFLIAIIGSLFQLKYFKSNRNK